MTGVLPNGYLGILDAADVLALALHGGKPDRAIVQQIRDEGLDVGDGEAIDRAIVELWNAVDRGTVRALVVGGKPRHMVRLDPALTRAIPALRQPRGRGFFLLRPGSFAYQQLALSFPGSRMCDLVVAFRETDINKLVNHLLRRRRAVENAAFPKAAVGRPSLIDPVTAAIRNVVEKGKWNPLKSMKTLTSEVNRITNFPRAVSDETVSRALDKYFDETGDRRFERVRRSRKPQPAKAAAGAANAAEGAAERR